MKKLEIVTCRGQANHDNLHRTSKDALKTGRQRLSSCPPCQKLFLGGVVLGGRGGDTRDKITLVSKNASSSSKLNNTKGSK